MRALVRNVTRYLLNRYCKKGIYNNKDYQNIQLDGTMRIAGCRSSLGDRVHHGLDASCTSSLFTMMSPPGWGVIKNLGRELDYRALRRESDARRRTGNISGWCRTYVQAQASS